MKYNNFAINVLFLPTCICVKIDINHRNTSKDTLTNKNFLIVSDILLRIPEIKQITFISQFARWCVTTFRNVMHLTYLNLEGEFIVTYCSR
jgi:hypothetical protein